MGLLCWLLSCSVALTFSMTLKRSFHQRHFQSLFSNALVFSSLILFENFFFRLSEELEIYCVHLVCVLSNKRNKKPSKERTIQALCNGPSIWMSHFLISTMKIAPFERTLPGSVSEHVHSKYF